jgi:hypothetical protein
MKIRNLIPLTPVIAAVCALSVSSISKAETASSVAQSTISGKFIGNGKGADLKFVKAEEDTPFNDQPAIKLTFTEKDPATVKGPVFGGELGCMLTLRVHHDGEIFGCQVAHTALKKPSFSSSGEFKMLEFTMVDGRISGRVSSGKEREFFGDRYDVDLTFTTALGKGQDKTASSETGGVKGSSLTAAQKAFLDRYKKAFAANETKTLSSFLYTQGASAETVEFFTLMQGASAGEQIDSIDLVKPSKEELKRYNEPTEMPDGELCKMPFSPTHQLVIVTKDGSGGTSTSRLPVGEHKGKLVIPLPVPVKSSPQATAATAAKPSQSKSAAAPSADEIEAKAQKAIRDALKNLPKGLRP